MDVPLSRAATRGELDEGADMRLVAVDATGRQQAEYVQRCAGSLAEIDRALQHAVSREFPGFDRMIDPRQVLIHDPAGADAHMADLGVAHLAVGQTDVAPRAGDQRMRRVTPERIPGRCARGRDRVVDRGRVVTPAIQYD